MLLEEYAVYINSNDTKPTTYTFALSPDDAKSHMLSPKQKQILAQAGRVVINLNDVEKLTFKKTSRTAPITTKKVAEEKITRKSFWWQEN